MSRQPLDAWLYGTRIATITDRGGHISLRWTDEAYQRWGDGTRVMSELLPVSRPDRQPHHRRVEVFLEGLLPEGTARQHLAFDAGLVPGDIFGMIEAYGRDTAGALIFVPEGSAEPTRQGTVRPLSDAQIGAMLEAAGRNAPALGAEPHLQSTSLAGIQPKIVLAATPDGWARCIGGYPSTHIVKLAHPAGSPAEDVAHTEVACLDLARAAGLTSISAELASFGGQLAIVVSRYDRVTGPDGVIRRVHQEDTAQALGINTADPARKFQLGAGLPSLARIAGVLRNSGSEPDQLLRLTAFNLAVGNTDAHAKNISLIRHPEGSAELAPAYDVAMHLHHRNAAGVFAMDVNGKREMGGISVADLLAEAQSWPLPRQRAVRAIGDTLRALAEALDAADTSSYPGVPAAAWETVRARTTDLLREVPAAGTVSSVPASRPRARQPRGRPGGGRFAPRAPSPRPDEGRQ
ncbi:MAG TPA: HipA domain-containing protein [Streptosporangiaceae bacterium]